jgi:hypothetical protein
MPKEGIFEKFRSTIKSEEEIAVDVLFPYSDKFRRLQMINEQQPKAITPWSVLGVFRRRYKSWVLATFQEEFNLNKIAQERKGRLELSEIFAARRKLESDKEKE